jgi:prolyl oligopeptidase
METGALKLLKESPIDIDTSNIESKQVFYASKDGTKVSMSLIYPKNREGKIPFLLTGYGGFNISLLPRFSTLYAVWVEAGGGLAIPNLRGGGEYGQEWHEGGMRDKKQNVFDDFIAAAEYLIAEEYTVSDTLAISGGSNGGLLVSAAVVQRPDLFQAVLCSVPLTDMVRYHTFGLANIWSEEYGNADDPEMFPYLHGYSPYHNVKEGVDYPSMLIVGSKNDARTAPIHALKFAAQARYNDVDHGQKQPIFLNVRSDSGHQGGVGLETQAKQYAQSYAYLMNQLGLNPQQEK